MNLTKIVEDVQKEISALKLAPNPANSTMEHENPNNGSTTPATEPPATSEIPKTPQHE